MPWPGNFATSPTNAITSAGGRASPSVQVTFTVSPAVYFVPLKVYSTTALIAQLSLFGTGPLDFTEIGAWWDEPGFLELIAQRVLDALALIPAERLATTEVLFSAHSLPEKILARGDNYPEQLRASAEGAARLAGITNWDLAWQSAGRTADPWIGPDILQVLRAKRQAGLTDIVSCPIGFVSDHLEVLFDIDIQAQQLCEEIGLHLVRTASLNDDPAFIAVLSDIVRSRA